MAGYFIGMNRYLTLRKALLATVTSAKFNTMSLNSKLSKVILYIQDNKSWERIYVILKIPFPCIWIIRLADINKAGSDKVFYYDRMTNITIIKSSSDIDNKELFPVFFSSSLNICSSLD